MKRFDQYFEKHNPFREEVEWFGLENDIIYNDIEEKIRELYLLDCPSAHIIYQGSPKISIPVDDFLELQDIGFAGNSFDSIDELRYLIRDLRNAGATEIEIGIAIVRPGDIYGDTLFFRGLDREQIRELLLYKQPDSINLIDGVWRIWWD